VGAFSTAPTIQEQMRHNGEKLRLQREEEVANDTGNGKKKKKRKQTLLDFMQLQEK